MIKESINFTRMYLKNAGISSKALTLLFKVEKDRALRLTSKEIFNDDSLVTLPYRLPDGTVVHVNLSGENLDLYILNHTTKNERHFRRTSGPNKHTPNPKLIEWHAEAVKEGTMLWSYPTFPQALNSLIDSHLLTTQK